MDLRCSIDVANRLTATLRGLADGDVNASNQLADARRLDADVTPETETDGDGSTSKAVLKVKLRQHGRQACVQSYYGCCVRRR